MAGFPLTPDNKQLTAYGGQREVADQAGQLGPDGPPGNSATAIAIRKNAGGHCGGDIGEPATPSSGGTFWNHWE